ncbi:MAG: hypothetical protein O2843_08140 [Chloroflexi bacterium]|nr:hypothetical protein [Chloroflexota bacterium]
MTAHAALLDEIARAFRAPFVPAVIRELGAVDGFLEYAWPQLAPSVGTAGYLGSALYMVDMALDAVEAVYDEPGVTRDALLAGGLAEDDLSAVESVLDVFHWLQPQLLLMLAALAEGQERPRIGGQGRADPRAPSPREEAHLATAVHFAPAETPPLPAIADALGLELAPELYRAVAVWPRYLEPAWDELQHLVTYPDFRRRGRALYYSRFLAEPLAADADALRAAGLGEQAIAAVYGIVDGALPALATMMMHCCAMRAALGLTAREVVTQH